MITPSQWRPLKRWRIDDHLISVFEISAGLNVEKTPT